MFFLKQGIPYCYIETAREKNLWNTLAYFAQLRAKYKKKIFYNFSSRTISKELGISNSTAARHIRIMIEHGWAEQIDGHLRLTPYKKLEIALIIPTQIFTKISHQIRSLQSIKIINNLLHQKENIVKKTKIVNIANSSFGRFTAKQLKQLKKAKSVRDFEMSINNRVTLTNSKIGEFFNVSKRTGSRIQTQMNSLGLIVSEPHYERVNVELFNLRTNIFLYKNLYYVKRLSNNISFNTHSFQSK